MTAVHVFALWVKLSFEKTVWDSAFLSLSSLAQREALSLQGRATLMPVGPTRSAGITDQKSPLGPADQVTASTVLLLVYLLWLFTQYALAPGAQQHAHLSNCLKQCLSPTRGPKGVPGPSSQLFLLHRTVLWCPTDSETGPEGHLTTWLPLLPCPHDH